MVDRAHDPLQDGTIAPMGVLEAQGYLFATRGPCPSCHPHAPADISRPTREP
jgi:hypothetical protein